MIGIIPAARGRFRNSIKDSYPSAIVAGREVCRLWKNHPIEYNSRCRFDFKCLILDHDDTAVASTPAIHYPAHLEAMRVLRPG